MSDETNNNDNGEELADTAPAALQADSGDHEAHDDGDHGHDEIATEPDNVDPLLLGGVIGAAVVIIVVLIAVAYLASTWMTKRVQERQWSNPPGSAELYEGQRAVLAGQGTVVTNGLEVRPLSIDEAAALVLEHPGSYGIAASEPAPPAPPAPPTPARSIVPEFPPPQPIVPSQPAPDQPVVDPHAGHGH